MSRKVKSGLLFIVVLLVNVIIINEVLMTEWPKRSIDLVGDPIYRAGILFVAAILVSQAHKLTKRTHEKKLVSGKEFAKKRTTDGPIKINHHGLPMRNTCIFGKPQIGKTTLMEYMIPRFNKQGFRCIILDVRGTFTEVVDGIVLNPFDDRYKKNVWEFLQDVTNVTQFNRIAKTIIPDEKNKNSDSSPIWTNTPRQMLAALLHYLFAEGKANNKELSAFLMNPKIRKEFLKVCSRVPQSARLVDGLKKSTITSDGIFINLMDGLEPLLYIAQEGKEWSLLDWIDNGTENILLPFTGMQSTLLAPIYHLFIDIFVAQAISRSKPLKRPVVVFLDEYRSLGTPIPGILQAMEKGLQQNIIFIVGSQTIHQLYSLHGKHDADTLLGLCENWAIFRTDKDSADKLCWRTGPKEVEEPRITKNYDKKGKPLESVTMELKEKPVVSSVQLQLLERYEFWVASGIEPPVKMMTEEPNRKIIRESFIENPDFRTDNLKLLDDIPEERPEVVYVDRYMPTKRPQLLAMWEGHHKNKKKSVSELIKPEGIEGIEKPI